MFRDQGGFVLVRDPRPQAVPGVRGERVDWPLGQV